MKTLMYITTKELKVTMTVEVEADDQLTSGIMGASSLKGRPCPALRLRS